MAQTTQQVNKKPIYCKWCQTEITFDGRKSKSGKSIPISVVSLEPHKCSKNPYNMNQNGQQNQIIGTENNVNSWKTTNELIYEVLYKLEELSNQIRGLKSE